MAAIQRCAQSTLNWDHFETEGLLLLQMHPAILPQVTIVGLAIILAWYFDTFDFGFFKFTSKEKGDPVDELLKKKHQVVGKECIPGKDTCFLIVDSYFLENGRLTTKRDLLLEENTEYSLTGVEVESVKPVSWNNLDSRNWPVNKLVINSRYARLLVASGFIMNLNEDLLRVSHVWVAVGNRVLRVRLQFTGRNLDVLRFNFRVVMLNQQHNQAAPQLLNVQRPHQIQPPGPHRVIQQGGPPMQQNKIPQGQSQMVNMQGQQGPQQMQQQPAQNLMMNMGQQMRPPQNQAPQMMQNPQQSQIQMRGNPPQQMRGMPQQGPPMQQSQQPPPQMSQMRMQQQQPQQPNMNSPQSQHQRAPNNMNMQQNLPNPQQQMRIPQAQNQMQQRIPQVSPQQMQMQQQQNMNGPPSHPHQMQQGGPQSINRPPSQPHQMQQGGGPMSMNRPPSQQMHQQGGPQLMNRPSSQMGVQPQGGMMSRPPSQPHYIQQGPSSMNTPPQQQMRMQQIQQNNQNMNNGSPHQQQPLQHQQMQQNAPNMNMPPQQQIRIQQQEPQMLQGQTNGPPPPHQQQQQQPVRVAQVAQQPQNMQIPPRQMTPQQSQSIHGSMQNSPQNPQMRMNLAPPQQQQQHHQNQPPMQGNPQSDRQMPQMQQPGRQIHPNIKRQPQHQMQQNRSMQQGPHNPQNIPDQMMNMQQMQQDPMSQQPLQESPQPNLHLQHHQTPPMQSQMMQPVVTDNFEPDNDQTIRINGEHAIINGMQYKLVPQQRQQNQQKMPNQQGQPMQQVHQGGHQEEGFQQQHGPPNNQGQNQQPPMQNQQNIPIQHQQQQQNMMNQPMQSNNNQNMANIQNQQNLQNPPIIQQQQQQQIPPAKVAPKPRYRGKKNPAQEPPPPIQQTNAEDLNNSMSGLPMGAKGERKVMAPSLTTNTFHQQQQAPNGLPPNNAGPMIQQGKNIAGGYPPNQNKVTPGKNVPKNQQQSRPQQANGKVQAKSSPDLSQPSTSKQRPPANKADMTVIRDAIVSHVKGSRKMTPEYIEYVCEELNRLMRELEKADMKTDRRYISVRKLLALIQEEKLTIIIPPRIPMPARYPPTEESLGDEPVDETVEDRAARYDDYMQVLANAYPLNTWDSNFMKIDDDIIRKEALHYRDQDMKNREMYLKENLHTFPEERQTKAKIEYLGLSLLDFQTELRKKVLATTVLVPPNDFLINPWSIRRTKYEYLQELKRHPDRAILEKRRKVTNFHFLQSLTKHAREFKEFHKRNMLNHTKVRKSMQQYITNENKRIAREEMKNEKNRIQKLIQEDEEGYRAMLDEKKDQRLVYLLEQTDDYIKSLCDLLKQQQNATAGSLATKSYIRKEYDGVAEEDKVKSILDKARNDDDEYENKTKMNIEDYYTTAHGVREEIKEQHFMMGGGNPSLKLKPYQIKGLEWMVSLFNNNLNGILADEMGLGKTIQTIAFITYLMEIKKTSGPFLVIVPLSTVPNWQNEFDKWAANVHLIAYKGPKETRKVFEPIIKSGKFNVLLTTFEYVIREKALLGKLRWKYMIIDEGHRLKNQHCKLTEMLNTRFQCQRRLLITGTPLQNKLPELWALLNFLLPSIFSSCSTFEQWFNAPFATTGEKVELTQEETMLIIRRLHKVLRPFLLRRLKKEVESELPDKMEFVVRCDMSALQKVLYKHMQKGLLLDGKTNTGSKSLRNTMIHLRKLCNHPFLFENVEESCRNFWDARFISAVDLYRVSGKLELLSRILPKLQATGHRVLMFFQMTSMMTIVEDFLAGGTIQYLRLDGSTKPDERGALLDKFNAPNSEYFLFMLSTRAGGLGLNLQTADTVIIFDSDWNPHQDMQAQDRAHRIGQKAEVRVFRLITANSVEEKILAAARYKLNVDEKVIQAGKFDNRSTGAERREILENIIKTENESEEDEEVPNDEDINDILSRSEEEFELFQKMDQERFENEQAQKAKPRLVGEDEIPRDILRAADETDYIEKAKEEGRVPYLEVMPGSRRTRREVDYSADTMSDDKFLEKLFDEDDTTSARTEEEPNPAQPGPSSVSISLESSCDTQKDIKVDDVPAPPLTFKVPRLTIKLGGDEKKRKHNRSESDSDDNSLKKEKKHRKEDHPKEKEKEKKKEKEQEKSTDSEKDLKRKIEAPIEKIRIKFSGEPSEKYRKINEEPPKKEHRDKGRKEEKSHKHRSDDDDSSPKKKKHRDSDESSEKKKKKHKHDSDSALKLREGSPLSVDKEKSPMKIRIGQGQPSISLAANEDKNHPPIKLKLNVKFNMPSQETDGSKKDKKEPHKEKEKDKEKEKEEDKGKEKEKHKDKDKDKEHKKKSREDETEEERRARKEAKRLKRQKEEQEDDAKLQEKLARKAAKKEQKRLEKEKSESSTGTVNLSAAGSA